MSNIPDPRHLSNGRVIPGKSYVDQPYVIKTDDGAWLCSMTTGAGHEGEGGQHVISLRSKDQGATWSKPVNVEPPNGPEASYSVLLKVPSGRIYCFYNHNTDRVPEVLAEDGKTRVSRVDSLGHYVFKYSDNHGRSWSAKRYDVPMRNFDCDRENVYGGKLRFFWNVGRPLVIGKSVLLVIHKVGAFGEGFFARSEGAFLRSNNILTEKNPAKIRFETLPDGDVGLRTPPGGKRISEEQNICRLSDNSIFCNYRSIDGHPVSSYSRDGGHTWSSPRYMSYKPGGKLFKHPRAANFVWRCSNGKFLYWFHNHGGAAARQRPDWDPYNDRNPAWIVASRECKTPTGRQIEWSQPEILLYDDDPFIRFSYPDLIEEDGRFFVTETQKAIGRVHEIPPRLLDHLFNQWNIRKVAHDGLILEQSASHGLQGEVPMPPLPAFTVRDETRFDMAGKDLRAGFTIDLWVKFDTLKPGQILLDNREKDGRGIVLTTTADNTVEIQFGDLRQHCVWAADANRLRPGKLHHITVIIDGGPKIISFVIDGQFCDGGDQRQFGWGRFSPTLQTVSGAPKMLLAPKLNGHLKSLRIYNRALLTSEAVGNYQAGSSAASARAKSPK